MTTEHTTQGLAEFRGHSDDVFCWCNDEHDDCGAGSLRIVELEAPDGRKLWVHGQYAKGQGFWMIGIQVDERDGRELVALPFVTEWFWSAYTPVLRVHVPEDTVARLLPSEDED